jgi:hypothetical protein
MRIRIFIRPENVVKLLSAKGKEPAWLRIRIGVTPATFSKLMAKQQSPNGKVVKRILYHLRGYKWDDIFTIINE